MATSAVTAGAATTWMVNTCQDKDSSSGSGTTGSLRYTILNAVSGDTIDLAHLPAACSKITLTSGFIAVGQNYLTLSGPGSSALTLSGGGSYVLFDHYMTGTFTIQDMTIADGYYTGPVNSQGGCLFSGSNIELDNVVVTNCSATGSGSAISKGGAVYAGGNLTLSGSTITGNHLIATGTATARGGGVYARGQLYLHGSILSSNTVTSAAAATHASGGGAFVHGYTHLYHATVAGNQANQGGGIAAQGKIVITGSTISGNQAVNFAGLNATGAAAVKTTITDSTISGNIASGNDGGVYASTALTLSNSTIAFNQAATGSGVAAYGPTLAMQSSIIAANTTDGTPADLETGPGTVVSGANNLVVQTSATVPSGTLSECPMLGVLRDNGGATQTHALLSHSPAIDTGNNSAGLSFDQRGTGYPRASGLTDIGAYEVQQTEIIFDASFDGCP